MIPICKPLLPNYEKLKPYLDRIDHSRWYTNVGPLLREYQSKLEDHFQAHVAVTSSGTSALTATLLAMDIKRGSFIALPSFTFIATAAAVVASGHVPYFCDVDNETWGIKDTPKNVDIVLGVYPFGRKVEGKFSIIDAAAAFDTIVPSDAPAIVSTHATKMFSTAEGGFVVCKNKDLIDRIRILINQGLAPDRSILGFGINGKMSEYHAAIGLAELDGWKEKRDTWQEVLSWYAGSNVKDIKCDATRVSNLLRINGVDTRPQWYGCANHKVYEKFPRMDLSITERLIKETIALPLYLDMTKEEVKAILEKLSEFII